MHLRHGKENSNLVLRWLLNTPQELRRGFLTLFDSVAVVVALWAAFALRLGEWWPLLLQDVLWLFPVAVGITIPIFYGLRLYRSIVRYAGGEMLFTVVKGVSLSMLLIIFIWVLVGGASVPRASWLNFWLVTIGLVGGSRFLFRDLLRNLLTSGPPRQRVAIYGAGSAGFQLAASLQHSPEFEVVAFIDSKPELHRSHILGLTVHHPAKLPSLVQRQEVSAVLLAMPSVSHRRRREILNELSPLPVKVMAVPGPVELASGTKRVDDVREVDVEDILGRDPVQPDVPLLEACIRDKVVMVTGAGGSIGSELCRQIAMLEPHRLVLFEMSEFALFKLEREVKGLLAGKSVEVVAILGSVVHRNRVEMVMRTFEVDTVYHAAAYKHVPMVEHNPIEGIQNNIVGTWHTAEAAIAAGVATFVLISTDKAVKPTSVMGATKRYAEMVLQGLSQITSSTRFCIVRFGNVLESSGSVVPVFRDQIRRGGPVTVTHPDVVRYFMTIPEAAQLVLQAGALGTGGEVFLLEMGEPVRILDLARRMVRLSGFEPKDEENPDGDIEIVFTGLRPGEKLYEELLLGNDHEATEHPMIRRAREESPPWSEIELGLERLQHASRSFDHHEVRSVLLEAVQGYQPKSSVQDLVWVERSRKPRPGAGMFVVSGGASKNPPTQ